MNCPFCGAQLPAGAPFCPACHQSLVEKATIPIPRPWRRKTGLLALFFLLFLLTGAVLLRSDPAPQPQTEVPAAEPVAQPVETAPVPEAPAPQILAAETKLTYDTGTDTYELFLSSSSGEYANEGTYVTTLNPGQGCFTPLLLVVQKDGHDARAEFTELLERAEVRVVCVSGEAMTCGQPAYDAEKPLGTLTVRVHMPENSEESQIFWTLTMKNGEAPDSAEAQHLVKTLQAHITENYYRCTNEILFGLGQMYAADERFNNNIDKHGDGTAAFIRDAITVYCGK